MQYPAALALVILPLLAFSACSDVVAVSPPAIAPGTVVQVWPEGKIPGHGANAPEAVLPERGDHIQRIANVSVATLTIFPAPHQTKPAPAMIVCPGGGYSYVTFNKEGTEIADWLNSIGITALVLKYRTPNNREGALMDLQRSVSLVRANAPAWGIDPHCVGGIGFSAGGHMVAVASTRFGERSYTTLDAIDVQSCRPDFAVLVYPAYLDDRRGQVSPDLNLQADIPPTLIVHNADDKTYSPGSILYNAALDQTKVIHQFNFYATGGHGYGLQSNQAVKVWPQDAAVWLHKMGIN